MIDLPPLNYWSIDKNGPLEVLSAYYVCWSYIIMGTSETPRVVTRWSWWESITQRRAWVNQLEAGDAAILSVLRKGQRPTWNMYSYPLNVILLPSPGRSFLRDRHKAITSSSHSSQFSNIYPAPPQTGISLELHCSGSGWEFLWQPTTTTQQGGGYGRRLVSRSPNAILIIKGDYTGRHRM